MTRLATPILDHARPINFWSTLNFCESVSTCKKSFYSIFFFKYSLLKLASPNMTGHTHFWPCQPLKVSITVLICMNLFQHAQNQLIPSAHTVNFRVLRWDLFNLFWWISSFKNHAIWLALSIFVYVSGTRFFLNIGFVQENSK